MKTVTINGKKYSEADIERHCTPITLSVKTGNRLRHKSGEEYIVAQIGMATHRLICLADGNRWSEQSLFDGSEHEFELIQS